MEPASIHLNAVPRKRQGVRVARRYSTALRAEQTAQARRRILDAAHTAFTGNGYAGTTLAGVAQAAGVSVQTVYNAVGGKPALLKAVYDVALAGDDEPVPMAQRPAVRAMLAAADGRGCLALYAGAARAIGERTQPVLTVLLTAGDADLRALADTVEDERAAGTRAVAGHLAQRFGLRDGLDVEDAAAVLWALTAPDVADRLVRRRGWGWDRFEAWLGRTMADAVLSTATRSPATG
ncbi:TetR/AcrR family transcriptional regulator [Pseudonocardia sp. KRD-169]|uniref:TetR/AcrR family transcriptional regulator n=1 Tax=Pseudonocardia abyssalis TaxID=2792008 RepID=A0ABS6UV06_9PSEU|nr:TetR/AcrR family transcriptional regulator [Pseudonocardia abyssalis]MBW0135569.1 TetR/AcrR family transcriptional regulator [Pseudonocardia abyssalis]